MNTYTKWEYKTVNSYFADLNSLGGEGWELCLISGEVEKKCFIFKRPKIDQTRSTERIKEAIKILASTKLAKEKLAIPQFEVGDWAIDKSGRWPNSYEIAMVKDDKVFFWTNGNIYKTPYSRDCIVICDNFEKYPKHNGRPVKKVNPNNPNNIRKGDWVAIEKDTSGLRPYGAYKVHSVKNGKLTIIYKGNPCFAFEDFLKTVYKIKKEDMKFYKQTF